MYRGDNLVVYRLLKEKYAADPLSTEGARLLGGRWNPLGYGILYTSCSPELALLEQMVHLQSLRFEEIPKMTLISLRLPEPPDILELQSLPLKWNDPSDYSQNHKFLRSWITKPKSLSLGVPSTIIPVSLNYLIHPLFPAYEKIKILHKSTFPMDPRLWKD
jgi:RES domain-containing protein